MTSHALTLKFKCPCREIQTLIGVDELQLGGKSQNVSDSICSTEHGHDVAQRVWKFIINIHEAKYQLGDLSDCENEDSPQLEAFEEEKDLELSCDGVDKE